MLIMLNLGRFEHFNQEKRVLTEFVTKAKKMVIENESQIEENKGGKLKLISLEKLNIINDKLGTDLEKIKCRMVNLEKKEQADSMVKQQKNLEEAYSIYRELLSSDPENLKSI